METTIYLKPSEEFAKINFGDKRLNKRLEKTAEAMTGKKTGAILSSCGSTHDAKAFYALLSNDKFSLGKVVETSQKATAERVKSSGISEVLLPQDTTDINLNGHKKTEGLGYSSNHTKGIRVHSCLALSPDGTNLGLAVQKYETRKTAKSGLSRKEKALRPVEEKESFRWLETAREAVSLMPSGVNSVILCDREGDFYELYSEMLTLNTNFIVRVKQDRKTVSGERAMQQIRRTKACGEVEISVPRDTRKNAPARTAKAEVAYCAVAISKPKHLKSPDLPEQITLNLVRITEICDGEPIEWILATDRAIVTPEDAFKTVEYYKHRWKTERFHFILKSGCNVEIIQQRTYERILPVLFIYSVIAAYILSVTYFSRSNPDTPCDAFLSDDEWRILYKLVTRKKQAPAEPYSIRQAVAFLGELGSFKHKPSDGDYGVKAVWLGLTRLFDALDVVGRLMG